MTAPEEYRLRRNRNPDCQSCCSNCNHSRYSSCRCHRHYYKYCCHPVLCCYRYRYRLYYLLRYYLRLYYLLRYCLRLCYLLRYYLRLCYLLRYYLRLCYLRLCYLLRYYLRLCYLPRRPEQLLLRNRSDLHML